MESISELMKSKKQIATEKKKRKFFLLGCLINNQILYIKGWAKKMGIDLLIGLIIGTTLIGAGYIIRTNKVFSFLAGFGETWEPVNRGRLGNRIGLLLII